MLRAEPALPPRGCGPCSWGCLPVSRAKGGGGQRILGCLVMMEQLGALLLASRARREEREGQAEIRHRRRSVIYTHDILNLSRTADRNIKPNQLKCLFLLGKKQNDNNKRGRFSWQYSLGDINELNSTTLR